MGHKHNKHNKPQTPPTSTIPAPTPASEEVAQQAMEALEIESPNPEDVNAPEEVAPEVAPEPVEAETAPAEVAPVVEPPKAEVKKEIAVAIEKPAVSIAPKVAVASTVKGKAYMAEDLYPSQTAHQKNIKAPVQHTPAGLKLISYFDEYDRMMATPSDDKNECKKRIMKLQQIMAVACPQGEVNPQVAADLVRIVFDRLNANWGTLYDEETFFRLDYSLPGGPKMIDRLNIYFTAILELVNSARSKMRITYVPERLSMVLGNGAIFNAIERMRQGLERRLATEAMR